MLSIEAELPKGNQVGEIEVDPAGKGAAQVESQGVEGGGTAFSGYSDYAEP